MQTVWCGLRFNLCKQFGVVNGFTFANSLVWSEVEPLQTVWCGHRFNLYRGGNSLRFSMRKISILNLAKNVQKITNKMFKRTKNP